MSRKIKVILLSAKGFRQPKDEPDTFPYVILQLGNQKLQSTVKKGNNPVWNEGFIFNSPANWDLHLELLNKERIKVNLNSGVDRLVVNLSPLLNKLPQTLNV
jgi:hypothetical protein